jgi:hypothetical protein
MPAEALSIEQDLRDSSPAVDCIFYESEYYIRLVNSFLQVACHKLVPALFPHAERTANAHISHHRPTVDPSTQFKSADSVGPALVGALARLRAAIGKQERSQEAVDAVKNSLLRLAEAMDSELEVESFFGVAVEAFTATMRNWIQLPLERSIGK